MAAKLCRAWPDLSDGIKKVKTWSNNFRTFVHGILNLHCTTDMFSDVDMDASSE